MFTIGYFGKDEWVRSSNWNQTKLFFGYIKIRIKFEIYYILTHLQTERKNIRLATQLLKFFNGKDEKVLHQTEIRPN